MTASVLGRSIVDRLLVAACALALLVVSASGCKRKASRTECDALIDRYAELVVSETYPDASTSEVQTERDRERSEARGDDAFKNCSSEVSQEELDCAMRARKADAFEKCLE